MIGARVAQNRRCLDALLADGRSPATRLHCEGGWYATLRVPRIVEEETLVLALLEEDGVFCHPGYFFDFPDEAYLVVSLLCRPEVLAQGLSRIPGPAGRKSRSALTPVHQPEEGRAADEGR